MNAPSVPENAALRIDAHHHLWTYRPEEFDWLDDSMQSLRRNFTSSEFVGEMDTAKVRAGVAVQARQSLEETEWLLDQAATEPRIAGVVGWAPIAGERFPAVLETLVGRPRLLGLRHIVQEEPEGFLDGEAFNRGIALFEAAGLTYDILVKEHQLPEAVRFVDRHPRQKFVLDHCAKPPVAAAKREPWAAGIFDLARRPNVFCKLSGMATEGRWDSWTLNDMLPYFDVVLEAFGPERVMAGSDWPVCLLATSYSRWWSTLHAYAGTLGHAERDAIFGGVAQEFYGLTVPAVTLPGGF